MQHRGLFLFHMKEVQRKVSWGWHGDSRAIRVAGSCVLLHHPRGVASLLKAVAWANSAARAPATICGIQVTET